MVAVLIICILMFGWNEVWSFHDAVVTSNNKTSEDIHPPDTAKLLSNFPSHDRKDNIITELHSEPENTLSSITQLLLQNPGVIPGGAIDLETNAINNFIRPKDSLNTSNKTATTKGYVINSPRKTASPSVNSALSSNIVDEGIDLKQGNDNTLRKTQRSDGSVNHFRSDPSNNMIATERNDFYIDNAKETETRFHNLLKTGKTDKAFISTHRAITDDKTYFKVGTENITPIPHQIQSMTSQTRYEITTKSTQNKNSEIGGIIEHAITNSFHRTDTGDKDDTISEKSVIITPHSNIDDLLKYRKLTSAVPLNVARLERLTRVDSRNLTQYNKLTSSIPVISTVTKTVPRHESEEDHSYSNGHKHNKNNVSTLMETRDNPNITGKETNDSSKLSSRKQKNHTEVSHNQTKIMNRKTIKDSRMNKTDMLLQGSESKNSILDKMETKGSKSQRVSPSFKTEKSNTYKALLDTNVVTSKKRKRRRRKYKNGSRQNYLKNDIIGYKASNKTVHVTKENTTSEYNLTSKTIHKHISKPKLLSDHSNRNLTKIFELEKKQIQRQKVNISRGSKHHKENITRKPVAVSKRIGKIGSLHFNQSKLEITSQNSDNKTIIISSTQQPMIIGTTHKQTDMANKTEQAKVQKYDLRNIDMNENENKNMNGNEYKDMIGNENKNMSGNKNKDMNRNENIDMNGNENKDMNGNENKDMNRNSTAIRINQSKLEIASKNSDNKTLIISTTQQPMIIGSTHKQTDMANKHSNVETEQAKVQKSDVNGNENKDMNGNENLDMNGNATAIRITKRNMNDTQRKNHNDTSYDSNKTNILVKLSEVQVTGIPIPFRRYSKLTTPSYRTTTVFTAKETNKEPVSMSKSFYSTPIPATKMSNSDVSGYNKTAHLENIKIHENENDHMPTGDQHDRNNIMDNAFNRLELLSTITTVKTHTKDISKTNGPKSTHSNNSSQIIDKESFFVDNTGQSNPWDQWLGSLSTNDKYPLQIKPRFENKTEIGVAVQNSAIIHTKRESNLTSTSSTPDFTNSPEMHSGVPNKYETTTSENIDTFNNLDYHTFVGKSEVVADKQSTNVSKISDSTSKSQEDLLTKWNALLQQFRKDNARKKSKLVQLLQNKSKSKNLKERHDVRFQKKPTSKSKYVKPTVEWLGIYKDLIKEQDKNMIPVLNKQLHHSSHSSLHDGNVHSQFVGEQLKTSCKEDQSYKLALNVLQTILMNMNNIKTPGTQEST
ncbi:Hypothetical predicted protein [Mytilus galloprovincialis]|uniref:Uncharacterized protein n=1 Tax=Mytilus galloprovincialis TaxID=29158 RepID=A0A8B6GNB8_MYTGA|nr:Hypothetical predicted protein [Mytilus galloprovincialis]